MTIDDQLNEMYGEPDPRLRDGLDHDTRGRDGQEPGMSAEEVADALTMRGANPEPDPETMARHGELPDLDDENHDDGLTEPIPIDYLEDNEGVKWTPEELSALGIVQMFIDNHPEGYDRGGAVAHIKLSNGKTLLHMYDEWQAGWM